MLAQQLKKLGLDPAQPPQCPDAWQRFLERIDRAYHEADRDRHLLERSMTTSSREMEERYDNLRLSAESRIGAERKKLRAVISAVGAGLCTLDLEGQVLSINPEAQRLLGCTEEDMLGSCFFDRVDASSGTAAASECADTKARALVASGQPHHEANSVFARKDKTVFPVSYILIPIFDEGTPRGAVVVFFDITERKRFEKEIIKAREKAEEMSHLKSAFLNNISHEIRTPLTAIIGFSAILSEESPPEQRELVDLIEQSGKRLLNTLNAVLDLSMLETGGVSIDNEWFDLVEVIQEKVASMQLFAREKNLSLKLATPAPRMPVHLDRACLDRILTHLIDNAIKFTHEGHVTVRLVREAERVCIRVEDTGVGIGKAFQPFLFDDFKQESTGLARSHEGAGLGLAVTRRMVNLMGGAIGVESTKGEGSIFEVSFGQPLMTGRAARTPSTPQDDRPKPCILVVEDTPEIEMLVEYMLSDAYEVMTTADEEGALELAKQRRFDLVLMDINLGSARNGVDVMDAMRELSDYNGVPMVAMTAYALLEDRTRFLEAGFDGYLSKPFTAHQAIDTIRQLLPVHGQS